MKKNYIQLKSEIIEIVGDAHLMDMSVTINNDGITSGSGDAKEEQDYYFGW
ncbi:MAG: hypothetical protein Q4F34_06245 [Prevotellaceae bacterium]|nr:hypothetical protein [Prevotellaceae bacterium]